MRYLPIQVIDMEYMLLKLDPIQYQSLWYLLIEYWKTENPLPHDDEYLRKICRLTNKKWFKIKPTILQFFDVKNGKLISKMLENYLEEIKEKSRKAQSNAKKRWDN